MVAAAHSLPVGENRILEVTIVGRVVRDPSPPDLLLEAPAGRIVNKEGIIN